MLGVWNPSRLLGHIRSASILSLSVLISLFPPPIHSSTQPGKLTGVYFPSPCLSGRSLEGILHYMEAAGLNLAVLHAKDPRGRLFWRSKNILAQNMGASARAASLERAVSTLKKNNIWIAAKLDVFQDSLLAKHHPEMGVLDADTGALWSDRKGLHWANPYDRRVWEYCVELALELIEIGVDEIQFDYVRFPSDGDLSTIRYPIVLERTSRAECIGRFLEYASSRLKPAGAVISVDLFGLTAWKNADFGVGQVLEQIAPHVDVICPMLYPSHFPKNFLGMDVPDRYPYRIMKESLEEMKKRTDKEIRPWIQGFWYKPREIHAQLVGVEECEIQSWTVWHPSGRYYETFTALAQRAGIQYPEPKFYPPLEDLRSKDDLIIPGRERIINYTSYRKGFSILSLDDADGSTNHEFSTLLGIVSTLDESIMDRILANRDRPFSLWTSGYLKETWLTELIIQDLGIDPCRMRPMPIYIDWNVECRFKRAIPAPRRELYQNHSEDLQYQIHESAR